MKTNFLKFVENYKAEFFGFIDFVALKDKKLLIFGDVNEYYKEYKEFANIENEEFDDHILLIQELLSLHGRIYVDIRTKISFSEFYIINLEEILLEKISIHEYLLAKEAFIDPHFSDSIPTINFKPFYDDAPSVRDVKSIGGGVEYLNKYLSSKMFNDIDKWKQVLLNFMKEQSYKDIQLLLNDRVKDADQLNDTIEKTLKFLERQDSSETFENLKHKLQEFGFEPGLGHNVHEIQISLELLHNLLNSPEHISVMEFMRRIPMIFNIVVVSSHGFFAQEGVLGLPDTGGQVVYILDQVRALEKQLCKSFEKAGLNFQPKIIILTRLIPNARDTTCDEKLEKIHNTKNSYILRVPFRDHNKKVTDNWISRFEIWPYLEEFAEDSYVQIKAEIGCNPDLVIGNYSDGNLVSYLLSKKFEATQCCIAHALEKSKYLFSDLYWENMENDYNFSLQFTADLIAINSSDFQITSTYQEIAGTDLTVGQYETHRHFTLPKLYRVENGVNLRHTKFNIISPGVNERIYFPYNSNKPRMTGAIKNLNRLFFENISDEEVVGELAEPNKIPIFSMARLDKNKNLTSLVRWFGQSKELQEIANLILVAGVVDVNKSSDKEEIEEIHLMHNLIEEYNLHDKIRWIGKLFRKDEAGEAYRIIADHKGVFVQPGLFEGFGLTVLEAMISGVPVIATMYGGPLEIIIDKKNGFHIDPIKQEESRDRITDIIKKFHESEEYWKEISQNSIKRVYEAFNWRLYAKKLLGLAKVYGFWKFSTDLETDRLNSYLDLLYHMVYKPRAKNLLNKHNSI